MRDLQFGMSQIDDASSGVALWRRVADSIERAIVDGRYESGTKLPGEMEIAESHRVNRHTVRRALAALTERGLVRAERGSGTYVEAQKIDYPVRSRTRFSEIVGAGGHEAHGKVLSSSIEDADRELARRLGLKSGAPLVRIDALRFAGKFPLRVGTTWMDANRFPEAAKIYGKQGSITRVLSHYGIRDYQRQWTNITAAIAEATDAVRLDIPIGAAVLVVDSIDADRDGKPLLTARGRFAAERVQFVVDNQ